MCGCEVGDRIGIPGTCYKTEKVQIPKSAGESAVKSARKKGIAGGTARSSAGRPVSLERQRNGTAPSSSCGLNVQRHWGLGAEGFQA